MMRVKDEADFLRPSLESMVDLVDEVVLVDNGSTDNTARIAAELAISHPGKLRCLQYPHNIARVGAENHALIADEQGRNSPRLLSNYYNWCLQKCRTNFILKWDGDMVATAAFSRQLAAFRRSLALFMHIYGANLHPDRIHLVEAGAEREKNIQERMTAPTTVSNWTSPFTSREARLFPRRGAIYTNNYWWCELLATPFDRWASSSLELPDECSFLHLKYCKPDPYQNFSEDFRQLISSGIVPGPPVREELRTLVNFVFQPNRHE